MDFQVDGHLDNPVTDNDDILKVMLVCHWRFQNSFAGANGLLNLAGPDNTLKLDVGDGFVEVDRLTDSMANCLAQNDIVAIITMHDITDILTDLSATISIQLAQARSDADLLYVFLTPWVEVLFRSGISAT